VHLREESREVGKWGGVEGIDKGNRKGREGLGEI